MYAMEIYQFFDLNSYISIFFIFCLALTMLFYETLPIEKNMKWNKNLKYAPI